MRSYSNDELNDLLNAPESEHYEFKEAKNQFKFEDAAKYCCALSNSGGGKLIFGVSDKRPRKVVGSKSFEQPERTRKDLMDRIRVRVDFQIYQNEDGRVLVFEVAGRPIGLPVQSKGIAWWRDGDSLVPMPEDVRRAIYYEAGHDFSGDICNSASIEDLDEGAIEVFRKTWIEYSGNKRLSTLTSEQLLRDADAISNEGVTYAALILFGKRAANLNYLPTAEISFEYRSSEASGPAAQRVDFREGFFNSFDRVWELVNLRNDKQHYQDRLFVMPVPTFNERVVREALLNAVSHRDYQRAGSIFVRQYRSKIVFESPGGFPPGITVENILDRQSPRNSRIANIFQLCGLVERSGQGMNLIYELAVREAKPLPDFTGSDEYFVKLTLDGRVINDKMLALMKQIGDERLEAMTTEDYLLLSNLFLGKGLTENDLPRFDHLAELEIVKYSERGVELVDSGIGLIGDSNAHAKSDKIIDTNFSQATNQATNKATDQATDQAVGKATDQAADKAVGKATAQAASKATAQATNRTTNQATDQATSQENNLTKINEKKALTEVEWKILRLVNEDDRMSQKVISEQAGEKYSTVKYYMEEMKKKGILSREGTSQKGRWIITL